MCSDPRYLQVKYMIILPEEAAGRDKLLWCFYGVGVKHLWGRDPMVCRERIGSTVRDRVIVPGKKFREGNISTRRNQTG